MAEQVKKAIVIEIRLESNEHCEIDIEVLHEEVRLTGAVRSAEIKAAAERAAASVAGVVHVENRISVAPSESDESSERR